MIRYIEIIFKTALITLLMCTLTTCISAQNSESDSTLVSNSDLIATGMELRSLRDSIHTLNILYAESTNQIRIMSNISAYDSTTIGMITKQNNIYENIIKNISVTSTTKWYNSRWVAFTGGILTSYVSAKIAKALIDE